MLALLRATRRTRARSAAIDGWSPISGSRSGAMGGMLARLLRLEEMLAVVLQLVDGFVDVGQRLVPALFLEPLVDGRGPAARQFLQGADVPVAVMERSEEHTSEL